MDADRRETASTAWPSPVPPDAGWPGDLASTRTPAALEASDVRHLASTAADLEELTARSSVCRACPRLVTWREDVARAKRKAYAGEPYWGRPITGWGDHDARILIVGLAPAAHGGNRTGRIFTGDRSGDWLFAALHRVGLARLATSVRADDGQEMYGARMVAAVRCAPPDNKPTITERDTCAPWLDRELRLLQGSLQVVVALGGFGWQAILRALAQAGWQVPRPRTAFGHGAEIAVRRPGGSDATVLGSYHPSQQNTFTGRLTEDMLDGILRRAAELASLRGVAEAGSGHASDPATTEDAIPGSRPALMATVEVAP